MELIITRNIPIYEEITWSELKAKRDDGKLLPNGGYRITDYICTTTQSETQSAGNQFDIIVVADSENTLNENARAIQHGGENDYFADSDLASWEIKYCIDNDNTRFAWADTTDGKGVIYYMKDEFANECPYDFKNIQFKRYRVTNSISSLSTLSSTYTGISGATMQGLTITSDYYWFYTMSIPTMVYDEEDTTYYEDLTQIVDMSLNIHFYWENHEVSNYWKCAGNIIKNKFVVQTIDDSSRHETLTLPNIVIRGTGGDNGGGTFYYQNCDNNIFNDGCKNITLYGYTEYNKFGYNDSNIVLGYCCADNVFGDQCSAITMANTCYGNVIDHAVMNCSFGDSCYGNKLGYRNRYFALGTKCFYNKFGDVIQGANAMNMGNSCHYNTVGDACKTITFGDGCEYNTVGNGVQALTMGAYNYYNTIGNAANNNSTTANSRQITIKNQATYIRCLSTYTKNVTVDEGVSYVSITTSSGSTASANSYLQNIHVHSGVAGTSTSAMKSVQTTTGNAFLTEVRTANDTTITV